MWVGLALYVLTFDVHHRGECDYYSDHSERPCYVPRAPKLPSCMVQCEQKRSRQDAHCSDYALSQHLALGRARERAYGHPENHSEAAEAQGSRLQYPYVIHDCPWAPRFEYVLPF